MFDGRFIRHEVVELMLCEETDLEPRGHTKIARLRGKPAGDEFREGRFAVAVRAEQRDAVVIVDPEIKLFQDGFARLVTDGTAIDGDDGEAGCFSGSGNVIGWT